MSSKPILNILHYRADSSVLLASKADIDAQLRAVVVTPLLACLSTTYTLTRTRVRWLDVPTDAFEDNTSTLAGGVTGDAYATCTAACFQLKSHVRGRSYNGSKHCTPISESDVIGDDLDNGMGALPARFNVLGGAFGNQLDVGTYFLSPVVVSQLLSPGLITAGDLITCAFVVEVKINRTVGTMRRRKEKTKSIPAV